MAAIAKPRTESPTTGKPIDTIFFVIAFRLAEEPEFVGSGVTNHGSSFSGRGASGSGRLGSSGWRMGLFKELLFVGPKRSSRLTFSLLQFVNER